MLSRNCDDILAMYLPSVQLPCSAWRNTCMSSRPPSHVRRLVVFGARAMPPCAIRCGFQRSSVVQKVVAGVAGSQWSHSETFRFWSKTWTSQLQSTSEWVGHWAVPHWLHWAPHCLDINVCSIPTWDSSPKTRNEILMTTCLWFKTIYQMDLRQFSLFKVDIRLMERKRLY